MLKRSILFIEHVTYRFLDDNCFYRASALTLTSLLAIVPLLVVVLSILSAFPVFRAVILDVQEFIFANFVPATGEAVRSYLLNFVEQAANLSMAGLFFLLATSVLMLRTIEEALNAIWKITKPRAGMASFILYWSILTVSPLLLGGSIALSTFLLTNTLANPLITKMIVVMTTYGMTVTAFSILYVAIPNCTVPMRAGVIAGLFAAALYELAKFGFAFYIARFSSYQIIYGALASIPVFIMWVYLVWLIILAGAEVCHNLAFSYGHAGKKKLDSFSHAFRWIGHLRHAQLHHEGLTLLELVRLDHCNYETIPEKQIQVLLAAGFICKSVSGKYFLSMDLTQLTFYDFYRALPWKLPARIQFLGVKVWEKELSTLLEETDGLLSKELGMPMAELYV